MKILKKRYRMGAGGFVIIDENTCMVDLVRYYMEFIAMKVAANVFHAGKEQAGCLRFLKVL